MTSPPGFSEPRRSFVKKTLATSVSISFAGLIRAHGEGSTGGTLNPDETTIATTDSGGTTTWNPDQTTYYTTVDFASTTWDPDETTVRQVSIQKQRVAPGQPLDDSWLRRTSVTSVEGQIIVSAGVQDILYLKPTWIVVLWETLSPGAEPDCTRNDCIYHNASLSLTFELNPQPIAQVNQIPAAWAALGVRLRESVWKAASSILNPGADILIKPTSIDSAGGPQVATAYSVCAEYGSDLCVPETIGPLVSCGPWLGNPSQSRYGYWLRVISNVTPAYPFWRISASWRVKATASSHCDLVAWVKAKIKSLFNEGLIQEVQQAVAPENVIVTVDLPALPEIDQTGNPFVQSVVAVDFPPTANGDLCPVLDSAFEVASGPTPNPEPLDTSGDSWDAAPPEDPDCPPP